jgi:hypothetical protein
VNVYENVLVNEKEKNRPVQSANNL